MPLNTGAANATHDTTLSAVSLPYYRPIMPHGLTRFKRFAETVWGVESEDKSTDEVTAILRASMG